MSPLVVSLYGLLALLYLFYGYCYGRLFTRAGEQSVHAYIPLWNIVVLLRLVGRPWWWLLILLAAHAIVVFSPYARSLPPVIATFVELGLGLRVMIDLARSFGKDTLYGVALGLLSPIMIPILAFSSGAYYGPFALQARKANDTHQ
jgi:hypothetical protein